MTTKERDFLLDQYISIGASPRFLEIQNREFVIPFAYSKTDDPQKSFLTDLFDFLSEEKQLYQQNNEKPVLAHCSMGKNRLRFVVPYHLRHEDPLSGKGVEYVLGVIQKKYDKAAALSYKLSLLSPHETISVKVGYSDLKALENAYKTAVLNKKLEKQRQVLEKLASSLGKNTRRLTFHLKNLDLNALKIQLGAFKKRHFPRSVRDDKTVLSGLDSQQFVPVQKGGKNLQKLCQSHNHDNGVVQQLNAFCAKRVHKATNRLRNITPDQLKRKARRWGLRVMLAATLGSAVYAASHYNEFKSRYQAKKELQAKDVYGNLAMFEKCRNDMRVSLAFVENFAPKAFLDGRGVPTIGYGCTYYIDENGRGNREISPVRLGDEISMEDALIQKDRYLNYRILPQIEKLVKVKMDEGTMIATVNFAYVIGPKGFRNSQYLQALNAGASKEELANYMTGFRKQKGLLSRNYFNAAELLGYISSKDKLGLVAEGCYNLCLEDVCVCHDGKPLKDENDMYCFDFEKLTENMQKACKSRRSIVNSGKCCPIVADILPDTIVQDVRQKGNKGTITLPWTNKDKRTR